MPDSETGTRGRVVAGRYRLGGELGRGGMGVVWLGEDLLVGRRVAVKELRAPRGLAEADREVFARRALTEARSAARIDHRNAVTLFDVLPASAADDAVYLIMELVAGVSLAEVIQRGGALPAPRVAGYGLQLLEVLAAAHALGIVHRDIKPANILIAGDVVKLADFGIAHTVGDTRLTRGGVMGTQAYMAPELFESGPITPAADLWSLGATLFAAIAGQGPFDRETTGATLRAIVLDDIPVPACEPALAAAIGALLRRDPAERATIGQARALLRESAAAPSGSGAQPDTPATGTPPPGPVSGPAADPRPEWGQGTTRQARQPVQEPEVTPDSGQEERRTPLRLSRVSRRVVVIAALIAAAALIGSVLAITLRPGGPAIVLGLRATMTNPGNGRADTIGYSPNGTLLAATDNSKTSSLSQDNSVAVLWNAADGSKIASLPHNGLATDLAFSPDGKTLAVADFPGNVMVWDIATHRTLAGPPGNIEADAVAYSPDGGLLAVSDNPGVLRQHEQIQLWDVAGRKWIATLSAPGMGGQAGVFSIAFSPDGKTLAAADGATNRVYLWNIAARHLIAALAPDSATDSLFGPTEVAFSPDGSVLAVGGTTGPTSNSDGVRLWDVASRTWGATLTDPHQSAVNGFAFSPNGRSLAVADENGTAYLWDIASRTPVATQYVGKTGADAIAFSPNGKTLAVSDNSNHVYLWTVSGG